MRRKIIQIQGYRKVKKRNQVVPEEIDLAAEQKLERGIGESTRMAAKAALGCCKFQQG
jgi:hypothetical protein